MCDYCIREIEKKDDKAVERVIRDCLIEFGANHEGTAWADPDLCRFSEIYQSEGNKYWVAENEDGKILGGVGIGRLDGIDGVCELQKMYCIPEARGCGIANKLMDEALKYAEKYYERCYLETLDNMRAAQRFYEKYGFKRIKDALVKTEHFACDVRYIKEVGGQKMKKVAFICVHNSCRSQIAEALGKYLASDVFESYSAGTETKPQINQDAVRIMKDLYGIDMEQTQYSKLITDIPTPDVAISMGCNVGCPFIGRAFDDNWGLDDPTGKSDEEFVIIIRAIERRILQLRDELK